MSSIVKVRNFYQVTLPAKIRKKFHIQVGDYVEVEEKDEGIVFKPLKTIDPNQTWFWSKQWQEMEKEADEAIRKGETSGPFSDAKSLIKELKK